MLLLSVKNLRELRTNPFPYIVLVIPCPLLTKLVRGEHFVLADLLKSILGSSSQVGFVHEQEPQAETIEEALTSFVRPNQSPLVEQDSQSAPYMTKKKRKKVKNVG